MWKVILLLIGCLVNGAIGCPAMVNKDLIQFKFCETTLVDNQTHLQVQCYLHAIEDMTSISVTRIGVIVTLKTALKITPNQLSSTCLQAKHLNVKKLNPVENENYIQSSDRINVAGLSMRLFVSSSYLELKVRLNSDNEIGLVQYNSNCISKLIQSQNTNGHFNVTQCVSEVKVLRAYVNDDGSIDLKFRNYFYNPDQQNGIEVVISLVFESWFDTHNGTVESMTITLTRDFPEFPKSVVPQLTKRGIKELHLPNNAFQTIKNDNFPDMTTLKILDFRDCSLKSIEPLAFQSMVDLVHLNLAGNRLKEIPQALTPLINLEFLNISSNRVSDGRFRYSSDVLGCLSNLKILDLSHMPLDSTKETGKYNSSNRRIMNFLQVLNLTNASLSHFPEPFNGMFPNLQILLLSDNDIKSDDLLLANTWNHLLKLELNENKLTSDVICSVIFTHFPKLQWLNLAKNNLEHFTPINLNNVLSHQRFLNLSGNSIQQWNEPMLTVSPNSPLNIDMTTNNITETTPAMLTDFSMLNHIYLSGNPFDCQSCELGQLQEWLRINHDLTDHDVSPYQCVFPKESVGQLVTNIIFDPDMCIFDWLVNVVLPILVVIVTVGVIGFLVLRYRWHLRYLWHIWRAKWNARRSGYIDLESPPEYRYEAFVSYSGSDCEWVVQHLIPMIEEQEPKLHLCVHERDFLIGEAIINNVIKCIDISRKSIFLISNNFIKSQWCQWELQMAQHKLFEDKKDVLVLIVLEELVKSDVPRTLQRLMASRTYHVWPGTHNAAACRLFWARLRQCIGPCHCLQKQLEDLGITFR